jgi:hypothetical protein
MPPFQSLEGNIEGFIEKLSWPTSLVMKKAPPTLDTDLGSSILQLTDTPEAPFQIRKQPIFNHEIPPPTTYV